MQQFKNISISELYKKDNQDLLKHDQKNEYFTKENNFYDKFEKQDVLDSGRLPKIKSEKR